jgi:hypothetical protein
MQGIAFLLVRGGIVVAMVSGALAIRNWWSQLVPPEPYHLKVEQVWELESGQRVADYLITGGLGDVSIALKGGAIHAPFKGEVQSLKSGCIVFSSSEVPAYLFRFCGVDRVSLGKVKLGDTIASADYLQFATLRKQPNGAWAIVEPSREILEQILLR